jgi:hypothetical protein
LKWINIRAAGGHHRNIVNGPGREACAQMTTRMPYRARSSRQWVSALFGDTGIILDGIAPYRWLNPNAPAKWMADVEIWRKGLGVIKEHLTYEMGFWNVEGSSAYAVISRTLTITLKDQSIVPTGTLSYTFARRDGVWKIEAQAWGRTS